MKNLQKIFDQLHKIRDEHYDWLAEHELQWIQRSHFKKRRHIRTWEIVISTPRMFSLSSIKTLLGLLRPHLKGEKIDFHPTTFNTIGETIIVSQIIIR